MSGSIGRTAILFWILGIALIAMLTYMGLTGLNPFGIQAVGNTIYVAYAKLAPDGHRDQSGAGNDVVDAYGRRCGRAP